MNIDGFVFNEKDLERFTCYWNIVQIGVLLSVAMKLSNLCKLSVWIFDSLSEKMSAWASELIVIQC